MEQHPLLQELLQVCSTHYIDTSKAFLTFETYLELLEERKLWNLEYYFNETLNMFYLTGKKEACDEPGIYVPILFNSEISLDEIIQIQDNLCQNQKQFYLVVRDKDSTSSCYLITHGLVKPDSPLTSKRKKELELQTYQQEKIIQNNRKILYSTSLRSATDDILT